MQQLLAQGAAAELAPASGSYGAGRSSAGCNAHEIPQAPAATPPRSGRSAPKKPDRAGKVAAQFLAALTGGKKRARRGRATKTAAVVAHSLPDGLQGLEPRGSLRRMKAHAFGRAVIYGDEYRHLTVLQGERRSVVSPPNFIRLLGDDRAGVGIFCPLDRSSGGQ